MIKKLLVMVAAIFAVGNLMAEPRIVNQEIKPNGNVKLTMTSDVPFQLIGTSDFVNTVVLKVYKTPKNHVIYIDSHRQKNEPYFFYFVKPLTKK